MSINLKKGDSFNKIIKNILSDQTNYEEIFLISDQSDDKNELVYSIQFDIKPINKDKIEISNIIHQEEGNSYHCTCRTSKDDDLNPAIYNLSIGKFERDIYLGVDRNDDYFTMDLTQALETMFVENRE